MNKHGWTYKKLGEVCFYPNNRISLSSISASQYVGVETLIKERGGISFSDSLPNADTAIEFLENDVLIGNIRPYLKKIWKSDRNGGASGDVVIIRIHPNYLSQLSSSYLYKVLSSDHFFDYDNANTHGAKMPRGDRRAIANFVIPVPPIKEQETIVAELDKINEAIAEMQQQIADLDALAQSTFYTMFGDPVTNEKGWEVKKLKDVSTLLNGRAYKQDELLSEGKYKVLRVGNFFTNSNYYYSDLELDENKYCDNGDLLFAWSASFGAFIWDGEKVIYHYHIWKVLFDELVLNKIFYQYLLNLMTHSFMNDLHGIGMMHLTKVGMEQYMLPIPPLALQQQFANRIEAIEAAKAELTAQIAEMQTLLASRMDYYFD